MKVALTTSDGRMGPCFAGVMLNILPSDCIIDEAELLSTHGWHPLAWGRELMRRDIEVLLCAGIPPPTWASLRGHGIQVVPGAIGEPAAVLDAWRNGQLKPPQLWPVCPNDANMAPGRRRKRRPG